MQCTGAHARQNPSILYSSVPIILCYSVLEEARAYFALFKIIILNLLVRKNNNLYLSLQFFLCSPNGPRPRGRDFNYSASQKGIRVFTSSVRPLSPHHHSAGFWNHPNWFRHFSTLNCPMAVCIYIYKAASTRGGALTAFKDDLS